MLNPEVLKSQFKISMHCHALLATGSIEVDIIQYGVSHR